ncbi:hypothetical protein D3C87_1585460 [compost metagenome]
MVADEQLDVERLFQTLDRRGNRGLRDVQLSRGFGDTAGFYRCDEILELPQCIGSHTHLVLLCFALKDRMVAAPIVD